MAIIRSMTAADVGAAVDAWRRSAIDMRKRLHLPPETWTAESIARTEGRAMHFLGTDPEGSWVAEDDGEIVGIGQAHRREGLFILSHLFVAPRAQNAGVGRALLDATLTYGSSDEPGLIIASPDTSAIRRYALAGFALHPTVIGWGQVRRQGLGRAPDVREGTIADFELAAEIDRRQRGAARTQELDLLIGEGDRLVVVPDRGYGLLRGSRAVLVSALDEDAATQLLTAALAEASGDRPAEVNRMTAAQQWAVRVTLAAGLELHPHGPILVRGNPGPLCPYLPDGALG